MTVRYRFPSQLDYEITSVALADDWLLLQKAGESRQGKCHPSALGFAQLSGGTYTGLLQRVNGMYIAAPGLTTSSPVYAFAFDTDTGIGSSASDQINLIAGASTQVSVTTTALLPRGDGVYNLGSAAASWGAAYFSNTVTARAILPETTATYDLGSSSYGWRNAYLTGTVTAGDILPRTTNTYDLGSYTYRWNDLRLGGALTFDTSGSIGVLSESSGVSLRTGGVTVARATSTGHFIPGTNSTYTLGTSGARWSGCFTDRVYLPNSVNLVENGGALEVQTSATARVYVSSIGLWPVANNTYAIGKSDFRWSEIWCDKASINTASDSRLKKDVTDSDLGLSFIESLRPVAYRLIVADHIEVPIENPTEDGPKTELIPKPGVRKHYGLIAQELRDALKGQDFAGYCYDEENDTYSIRYGELIAPLIKAVQELSARVNDLEGKLAKSKDVADGGLI